ncbi:CPBP family intramembrane metalloprotease [Kribbella sandramycini]|uniref:CPBP family intramembrane metalloprotease n=1 Tax=Kribbella sandramycini TaxID=60450 RepID=A0A7Y4L5Z7_9ACTN|nr:type II CAAX endopeptidase family protein [Kribbella sandramycini]MBB6570672.1 membrane protease YdiL (CAAX protease family) [Kribbella sandramycini]NOL43816.1 CPBP family intramembrane metalloprotease [Kribbella sandramycini]
MSTPYQRLLRNEVVPRGYVVLGALTIFVGWAVWGIIVLSAARAIRIDPPGTTSWITLLATNLYLISLIPLSIVVARLLNRQTPGLLSSVVGRLRWRPLLWFTVAALVCELLSLLVIKLGLVTLLHDNKFSLAPDAVGIIAVVLLTSPIQAAAEEFFFRGYLLQAAGALVRSPIVIVLVTTILFTMAHGVWPWESLPLFLDRFAFGVVAGVLAILTGGIEAPIAVHVMNNVVTFIYAALTDSVGSSLGASSAPWSLVILDIAKFAAFGALAVWLARRQRLETVSELPLARLPLPGSRLM